MSLECLLRLIVEYKHLIVLPEDKLLIVIEHFWASVCDSMVSYSLIYDLSTLYVTPLIRSHDANLF